MLYEKLPSESKEDCNAFEMNISRIFLSLPQPFRKVGLGCTFRNDCCNALTIFSNIALCNILAMIRATCLATICARQLQNGQFIPISLLADALSNKLQESLYSVTPFQQLA